MAQSLQVFFILSHGGVTGKNLELEAVDGSESRYPDLRRLRHKINQVHFKFNSSGVFSSIWKVDEAGRAMAQSLQVFLFCHEEWGE